MTMQPDELKAIRKQLDLTQAELGTLVGLSVTSISLMEADKAPIEARTEIAVRERLKLQEMMNKLVRERDTLIKQAEALEADPCLLHMDGSNASAGFARMYREQAERLQDAIEIGQVDYGLIVKAERAAAKA